VLHNAAARRLLPVCKRVTFVAPDDKLVFAERCYGMSRLVARSFCFDAGELGYLAPLLHFIGDQLAEVAGREDKWCAPQIGEPSLDLGIGEARVDLPVEPVDDLAWRVLGRADA